MVTLLDKLFSFHCMHYHTAECQLQKGAGLYLRWSWQRRAWLCVGQEALQLVVLVRRCRREAPPEDACKKEVQEQTLRA